MRLKKVEILGFKSFADKVTLTFDGGVTAIVGPNGCGKSNICDAFRWVLGEQSAKSMRGGKMLDVIFAGTAKRLPVNIAEVTLHFDGIEEAGFSEVAVMRRLHRNGDSDYFINKRAARLKDIVNFFLDSGVGKDAFAIFEQGKIDHLINSSPLERRTVFEEAAGILRFLQEKRVAFKKLEHVDSNLARVEDVFVEVESQIAVLTEQAEKARDYKEKKQQFESLEKGIFFAKWESGVQAQEKMQGDHQRVLECCQEMAQKIEGTEQNRLESLKQLDLLRHVYQEKNLAVHNLRRDIAVEIQQINHQKLRIVELQENEKKWLSTLDGLVLKSQEREREKEALTNEIEEAKAKANELAEKLDNKKASLKGAREEVERLQKDRSSLEQKRYELLKNEKRLEGEVKQLQVQLEHGKRREKLLQEEKSQLSTRSDTLNKTIEKEQQIQAEREAKLRQDQEKALELEKVLTESNKEMDQLEEELKNLEKSLAVHLAREKVLLHLREEKEGFSNASKRLLKESGNQKSSLYQKVFPLYELMTQMDQDPEVVAFMMRAYAHTLAVKKEEDYEAVIVFAKENQLKDFSLFCLEHVKGELSEHFLQQVSLEKDVKSALKKVKLSRAAWTKEGIFIDDRFVTFYQMQKENNVFLRENELKKLKKLIKESESQVEKIRTCLEVLRERKQEVSEKKKALERLVREQEMSVYEKKHFCVNLQKEREEKLQKAKEVVFELTGLKQELEEMANDVEKTTDEHLQYQKDLDALQDHFVSSQEELEKKKEHLLLEEPRLHELNQAYLNETDVLRQKEHALELTLVKDKESQQLSKRLEEDISQGKLMQEKITEEDFTGHLSELEANLCILEQELTEQELEVKRNQEMIREKEKGLDLLRGELKTFEEKKSQLDVKEAQTRASLENLEYELLERYQLKMNEVTEELALPLEKAEKLARSLRRSLEETEDVNMTSIEALEEQKVRFGFLQQQIDDLKAAKQELVQIITELDGTSRKAFKETFGQIKENFKKNFTLLFQGGEADISLMDSGDILEAGIEIIAKPPGKKMQSIQLLSGGEKCLTAMALLFAIFEIKPAPFCILDEIDAPLDDANVERFSRLVKQFSDRCQFIVITHNRGSMEIADRLLGVSMQEKGVSKVMALQFSENEVLLNT